MAPSDDKSTPDDAVDAAFGDAVDMITFNQILEMDEPGDCEFSSSIVFGFFDQAKETFESIDSALQAKDLKKVSSLGHFLKGSSATLGLVRVRDGCEKIERFGKNENVDGTAEPDCELCLKRITEAFKTVKTDYQDVEGTLKFYYDKKENEKTEDA